MNNINELLPQLRKCIKTAIDEIIELDKLLAEIKQESDKQDKNNYYSNVDLYGIGYAILKWCKENNKYFSENLLNVALNEQSMRSDLLGSNFAEDVLRIYKKNLSLPQYKKLTFEDSE